MPHTSDVTGKTRIHQMQEMQLESVGKERYRVAIQDNGPGIPDDLRRHVFDPFVTTKQGGTGLGLPLVAKLIGDHGGVIDLDSRPRRTVFRIMLPITREEGTDNE